MATPQHSLPVGRKPYPGAVSPTVPRRAQPYPGEEPDKPYPTQARVYLPYPGEALLNPGEGDLKLSGNRHSEAGCCELICTCTSFTH